MLNGDFHNVYEKFREAERLGESGISPPDFGYTDLQPYFPILATYFNPNLNTRKNISLLDVAVPVVGLFDLFSPAKQGNQTISAINDYNFYSNKGKQWTDKKYNSVIPEINRFWDIDFASLSTADKIAFLESLKADYAAGTGFNNQMNWLQGNDAKNNKFSYWSYYPYFNILSQLTGKDVPGTWKTLINSSKDQWQIADKRNKDMVSFIESSITNTGIPWGTYQYQDKLNYLQNTQAKGVTATTSTDPTTGKKQTFIDQANQQAAAQAAYNAESGLQKAEGK